MSDLWNCHNTSKWAGIWLIHWIQLWNQESATFVSLLFMYDSLIFPLIDSILIKSFVSGLLVFFIARGKMIKYQYVLPTRHTDGQKCLSENVKLSQLACPTPVCQSIRKRATSHNRCCVGQSALQQLHISPPAHAASIQPASFSGSNSCWAQARQALCRGHSQLLSPHHRWGKRRVTTACHCDRQCVIDKNNSDFR